MVPRPSPVKKVQPREIALEADDLVEEEVDNTEPSGPPVVIEAAPAPKPAPKVVSIPRVLTPIIPPPPGILIGPSPTPAPPPPIAAREIAMSLPSQYELDSERKSSPPIAERRKELAKYVASAVGVAWFICTCAIGETALRSIIGSMH